MVILTGQIMSVEEIRRQTGKVFKQYTIMSTADEEYDTAHVIKAGDRNNISDDAGVNKGDFIKMCITIPDKPFYGNVICDLVAILECAPMTTQKGKVQKFDPKKPVREEVSDIRIDEMASQQAQMMKMLEGLQKKG